MKKSEKLFKMLKTIKYINIDKFDIVRELVKSIQDKKIIIKEKKWADSFYEATKKSLDLTDIKTWSTFDGSCISLKFSIVRNKILCEVSIYEGDSMNGYRTDLRFTAKLEVPKDFLIKIEYSINYIFERYLYDKYEEFLNKQAHKFVNNLRAKILA